MTDQYGVLNITGQTLNSPPYPDSVAFYNGSIATSIVVVNGGFSGQIYLPVGSQT